MGCVTLGDLSVEKMELTSVEGDWGTEEEVGQPRLLQTSMKWEDYFGSSVSLAPSLLSYFDNYTTDERNGIDTSATGNEKESLDAATKVGNARDMNRNEPSPNKSYQPDTTVTDSGEPPTSAQSVTACEDYTGDDDVRKRPLSMESMSSQSTSSLPRTNPCKKMAGAGALGASAWMMQQCMQDGSKSHNLSSPTHSDIIMGGLEVASPPLAQPEEADSCSSDHDSSSRPHSMASFTFADQSDDISILDDSVSGKSQYHMQQGLSQPPLDGALGYIDRVVAEIIETERTYVRDLQDIIQGYLAYIREEAYLEMNTESVTALFGNIEEICAFNQDFLHDLEQCNSDTVEVAQCFVNKKQGFDIYTFYCTNYPRSVEVLTECMRDPHKSEAFRQQQFALDHNLPLGSYLLKPVQRILKYHLLLQNIVKNYGPEKPGADVIQEALESMTGIAQHINEMKRRHEHAVRVQEIQSLLFGWEGADLTTFGDLVLEDTFRMYGAKAFRQLFLFDNGLFIAKKKEDGTFAVKATIMCSNLMLIESIPKEPLSFHVIPFDNPRMQYTVQAKNLEQKRRWCFELKRLLLENYNAVIPDKAKKLVMVMMGKSREEEALEESHREPLDSGKKQHSAPEYLEKRKTRRRSTSIIPGGPQRDFGLLQSRRSRRNLRRTESVSPRSSPKLRRRREEQRTREEDEEEIIEEDTQDMSDNEVAEENHMRKGESEDSLKDKTSEDSTGSGKDSDMSDIPVCHSKPPPGHSAKRAESYRKATELDRVDSRRVIDSIRAKYRPQDTIRELSPEKSDSSVPRVSSNPTLSSQNSPSKKSPQFSPGKHRRYVGRVKIRTRGGSFNEGESRVIANEHTKSTDSLDSDPVSKSHMVLGKSLTDSPGIKEPYFCHLADHGRILSDPEVSNRNTGVYDNLLFHPKWRKYLQDKQILDTNSSGAKQTNCCITDSDSSLTKFQAKLKQVQCKFKNNDESSKDVSSNISRSHSFSDLSSRGHESDDEFWVLHRRHSDSVCFANRLAFEEPLSMCRSFNSEERQAVLRYCTPPRELIVPPCNSPSSAGIENQHRIPMYEPYLEPGMVYTNLYNQNPNATHRFIQNKMPSREIHSANCSPVRRYILRPRSARSQGNSPSTDGPSRNSHGIVWQDLMVYAQNSPKPKEMPKFPTSSAGGRHMKVPLDAGFQSPYSNNGGHYFDSDPTSPCSVASNDSLMDSLKNAFSSFTSKFSKSPRSAESSPSRSFRNRRPRSVGEIEAYKVNSDSKHDKSKHKFAKMYGDKLKKSMGLDRKSGCHDKEHKSRAKQLIHLLKENKPGSSNLGARIAATSKPIILGHNYTLPRQRPARPKPAVTQQRAGSPAFMSTMCLSDPSDGPLAYGSTPCMQGEKTLNDVELSVEPSVDVWETQESKNPTHDSGCLDAVLKDLNLDSDDTVEDSFEHDLPGAMTSPADPEGHMSSSGNEVSDESLSDSFYEKRLAEHLEWLESDLDLEQMEGEYRDSAVYSDDGAIGSDLEQLSLKLTIKQKVKLIERHYQNKIVSSKTEVKKTEKAHGIKDMVKHLEEHTKCFQEKDSGGVTTTIKVKSVRERKRELIECATLTRIRQDSARLVDDTAESKTKAGSPEETPVARKGSFHHGQKE